MALEQRQYFCQECQRNTLHTRTMRDPSTLAHLVITLFLCGLWLPVWLLSSLSISASNASIPFRCNTCGRAYSVMDSQAIRDTAAAIRSGSASGAVLLASLLGSLLRNATYYANVAADKMHRTMVAASPLIKTLPSRTDASLAKIAGDGNVIVHQFLRVLAVSMLLLAVAALFTVIARY